MKTVSIEISGDKILLDEGGATLPEMIRICSDLVHNLSGMLPKTRLEIKDDGGMYLITDEPAQGSGNYTLNKHQGSAVIKMTIENGHITGGDVQHNSQSKSNVIKALNFIYHKYAKRMVKIAEEMVGTNEADQGKWIEKVLNENKI